VRGIPKEVIEAWILGDEGAFQRALDRPRPALPRKPEELWGKPSDPQGNHPKQVLKRRLAELLGSDSAAHFARAKLGVAAEADPIAFAAACPVRFAPFADELRSQMGPLLESRVEPTHS
jgi:hypothetical protein